jgi:nucleoside-diphosphate-sugar epimerase
MKKILITGASGFIGGYLVEEAITNGLNAHAGIRSTSSRKYLQSPDISFAEINFEDQKGLTAILEEHDFSYIIHNAGLTQAKSEEQLIRVNATYLEFFIQALRDAKVSPEKFTYISSLAAYGPADFQKDGIVSHNSTPNPVTKYGRSKLIAEQYLQTVDDIEWNIVRPTAVYGPREHELLTVFKAINNGIEAKVGFETQQLTFIYVMDLVKLILDVTTDAPAYQSYFAGDGHIYSTEELNMHIRNALDKKTLKFSVPITLMSALAFLNQSMSKITGKYPILNYDKINEIKAKSWAIDTANVQNDINFAAQTKLAEGIIHTVKWYKENNWL